MQLLYVCTKQGIKNILLLLSNSTLCGSCVRRIADTRLREKRQVVSPIVCQHVVVLFTHTNTSWPTLVFSCVGPFNAK